MTNDFCGEFDPLPEVFVKRSHAGELFPLHLVEGRCRLALENAFASHFGHHPSIEEVAQERMVQYMALPRVGKRAIFEIERLLHERGLALAGMSVAEPSTSGMNS